MSRPLPSQDSVQQAPEYKLTISLDGLDLTVPDQDWVTLRQASQRSGVNQATVRNWARRGRVSSRLDESPDGPRRLVVLDQVMTEARRRVPEPEVPAAEPTGVQTPEGHMLVPLEAWEKMLIQLGNLHEAGQQLAEARERAAKAETESTFLRERLSELRADREEIRTERDGLRERFESVQSGPAPSPPTQAGTGWRRAALRILRRPKW